MSLSRGPHRDEVVEVDRGAATHLVRAMVDALNEHDVEGWSEFYTDDVLVEFLGRGTRISGRPAVAGWLTAGLAKINLLRNEICGLYWDGDVVVLDVLATGTISRPGGGAVEWDKREIYVYQLRQGLIASVKSYT